MKLKLLTLTLACTTLACAQEKAKLSIQENTASSLDAMEAAGPQHWHELQLIESFHPYSDHTDRTWEVQGSENAIELRLVFERFELEPGYDWLTVTDASGEQLSQHTGRKTGHEVIINSASAKLTLKADYSVTGWGFAVRVYERQACVCAEIYQPVCGEDGQTYGNDCEASCQGAKVMREGACDQAPEWARVFRRIESPSPYENNTDLSFRVGEGGARKIRVHFSSIDVERGYDFVRVLDKNGKVINSYSGAGSDITSAVIEGDELTIRLTSDRSITKAGFVVDYYEVIGGCATNADCGAGARCVQVQCIRAPCFALCEQDPNAPQPFTLSSSGPAEIPDNNTEGATSILRSRQRGQIESLLVDVDISHTYRGDLEVSLIAPSGDIVKLHNQTGGSQHDYVVEGRALNELVGQSFEGEWKLTVRDLAAADTGVLNSWSLTAMVSNAVDCSAAPDPLDPGVRYISQDADQCAAIRFTCNPGEQAFSSACGCGCN